MNVVTESWWSPALGRTKSVTVVWPAEPGAAGGPYPVLYLLHGYGGNRETWLRRTRLAIQLAASRVIVVFPECGRYWFINDTAGRRYEDYLVDEVVGRVDDRYPTVRHRCGRAIAGFSMGGACAVFQALRHPDRFSVAASHSGAFEAPLREGDPYHRFRSDPRLAIPTVEAHERVWGPPGSSVRHTYNPYHLIKMWDPAAAVRLYLDVGLDDYDRMIAMSRNVHDALVAAAIPHQYRERPGGHDWDFVDAGLPDLFAFLRANLAGVR